MMNIEYVIRKSDAIRKKILKDNFLSETISSKYLHIPKPNLGKSNIKLIIIVSEPDSQTWVDKKHINTVLNLDSPQTVYYVFISRILKRLHFKLDNLYATNLNKCFLEKSLRYDDSKRYALLKYWIGLLKEEISNFPQAAILSLSERMNASLLTKGRIQTMYYWNYIGEIDSMLEFKFIPAENNILNRNIYPFPHFVRYDQSTFYRKYFDAYLDWMKKEIKKTDKLKISTKKRIYNRN